MGHRILGPVSEPFARIRAGGADRQARAAGRPAVGMRIRCGPLNGVEILRRLLDNPDVG
jgi:hypothetical protein